MNSFHRILFLFSIALSLLITCRAQDYKAINPAVETTFFGSIYSDIISIRIDSVTVAGEDTYYHNFRQLRLTDYGCYALEGSWLGDEVIEKPDGTFIFRIYPFSPPDSSDSYRILTRALPGHPWSFYRYHAVNHSIEAEVTSTGLSSFLGITDSVKVISLTRKDAAGQTVADPVNSQTILLSKNNGLIRLPKFDDFLENLLFYDFSGISSPETGITNLTTLKIFDYLPGDVFHSVMHEEGFSSTTPWTTRSTILKILTRTDNPADQSVSYLADRCYSYHQWLSDSSQIYSYDHDTVSFSYSAPGLPLLEAEPLEPAEPVPASELYTYTTMGIISDPNIPLPDVLYKAHNSLNGWQREGDCFHQLMIDDCSINYYYLYGLGGPYYSCNDLGFGHSYNQLVYYKKGGTEWGTPLSCDSLFQVSIAEARVPVRIRLYPNPCGRQLTVEIPDYHCDYSCILELTDLAGRPVAKHSLRMSPEILDVSDLPSGIYLCIIKNGSGERIYQGKIIR